MKAKIETDFDDIEKLLKSKGWIVKPIENKWRITLVEIRNNDEITLRFNKK